MITEVAGQVDIRSYFTTTGLCTLPLAVTSGNMVIVAGAVWDGANPITVGVSKNSGTAVIDGFTTISTGSGVSWGGGFLYAYLAYTLVTGSGVLQTLTTIVGGSGDNSINLVVDEFTDVDTATVLDVNGSYFNGAASAPADSLTTSVGSALILGVMATSGEGGSFAPGAGYTQIWEDESGGYAPYSVVYKIAGSPGVYAVDWSSPSQNSWSIVNASFRPYVPFIPPSPPASVVAARPLRNAMWY